MAFIYGMVCVMVVACAFAAGWDFKPPHHNNRWGFFWLILSIVCMVLVLTSYDVFVGPAPK